MIVREICTMASSYHVKINFDILSLSWIDVTSIATGKKLSFDFPFPETVRETLNKWMKDNEDGAIFQVSREDMVALRDAAEPNMAPVVVPTTPVNPVVVPTTPVPSPVPTPVPVNPVPVVVPTTPTSPSISVSSLLANKEGKYIGFTYDIPSKSKMQNPSSFLGRFARRWQLSNWIVPIKCLPKLLDLMETIKNEGGDSLLIEYAPSMDKELSRRARENFDKEVQEIHTSLILTLDNASKQYEERMAELSRLEETEGTLPRYRQRETYFQYRNNRIKTALKQAEEKLRSAVACAEQFEDTMELAPLFQALREAIQSSRLTAKKITASR